MLKAVVLLLGAKEKPSSDTIAEMPEDFVLEGKHFFSLSKQSSLKKENLHLAVCSILQYLKNKRTNNQLFRKAQ